PSAPAHHRPAPAPEKPRRARNRRNPWGWGRRCWSRAGSRQSGRACLFLVFRPADPAIYHATAWSSRGRAAGGSFRHNPRMESAMPKFARLLLLAALLPLTFSLAGCVVYGPGPAPGGAWANYDYSAQYGMSGYGPNGYCPPGYGDPYAGYYGGY